MAIGDPVSDPIFGPALSQLILKKQRADAAKLSDGNGGIRDPYQGEGEMPNPDQYLPGYDNGTWNNVTRPTAFDYGGVRGGAATEENRYQGLAAAADARQGAQINNLKYNLDRQAESYDKGQQQYGLDQYRNMIEGKGPSVAEQQMGLGLLQARQQDANSLQAAQNAAASRAASARGGGANLAAAQMQGAQIQGGLAAGAQANQAQLGQQAVFQGGMLRAQEQQQALQGYAGLSTQQRAADLQREGMSADQAYKQATLEQQQHTLNDQRNLAYEGMRQKTFEDQLNAQMAGEAQNAGVTQAIQNRKSGEDQANANRATQIAGAVVGGIGTAGASLAANAGAQAVQSANKPSQPSTGTYQGSSSNASGGDYGFGDPSSDIRGKEQIGSGQVPVRQQLGALGQSMPSPYSQGRGLGLATAPGQQSPNAASAPSPAPMMRTQDQQYTPPSMRVGSGQLGGGGAQGPGLMHLNDVPGRGPPASIMSDTRAKKDIGDGGSAARAQLTAAEPPLVRTRDGGVVSLGGDVGSQLAADAQRQRNEASIAGRAYGRLPAPGAPVFVSPSRMLAPGAQPTGAGWTNDEATRHAWLAAHPEEASYYATHPQAFISEAPGRREAARDYGAPAGPAKSPRAVSEQLSVMKPNTYRYKEPEKHGEGERIGVMAQDMEKGPYGHQLVKNTPDGKKIDGAGGLSLALAGTADHEHRLRAIEGGDQAPATLGDKMTVSDLGTVAGRYATGGVPGLVGGMYRDVQNGGPDEEERLRALEAQRRGLSLAAGQ